MKALIVALGISSVLVPSAAQAGCLQISHYYTSCNDYRGNQYSIQTFGPNTFVNRHNPSPGVYYSEYRRGDRHRQPNHYGHKNGFRVYSLNRFKRKNQQAWQYYPYWQQRQHHQVNTQHLSPQFSTYWHRNPWARPSYHNQQNIYLRQY